MRASQLTIGRRTVDQRHTLDRHPWRFHRHEVQGHRRRRRRQENEGHMTSLPAENQTLTFSFEILICSPYGPLSPISIRLFGCAESIAAWMLLKSPLPS